MFEKVAENYLQDSARAFENYKKLAEKSFAQVSDEEFFVTLDEEANSIATITKHVGGNLRSRWTDFLTTDGEKPDRHRDSEFVVENDTRDSLMKVWENGWQSLFETLKSLTIEDLSKIIMIRSKEQTVVEALNRSLAHTAYHIGQIVFLAKHFRSNEWQTLSIPRHKSDEFNQFLAEKKDSGHFLETHQEFAKKDQK